MSDSNELITSDEDSVEYSDSQEDEREELVIGESSDAESADESIIRKKPVKTTRRAVIQSDTDTEDEEEEAERRAFSPRTRMSITGIRPADLSNDSSEIEYSESEESADRSAQRKSSVKQIRRTVIDTDGETDNDEEEIEQRAFSPRTRMSINGLRPASLSNNSSAIEYSGTSYQKSYVGEAEDTTTVSASDAESEANDTVENSPAKRENSFLEQSAAEESSYVEQSVASKSVKSSSADASFYSADEKVAEEATAPATKAEKPTRTSKVKSNNAVDSPMSAARYSMQFEKAIKEKLSSTMCQPRQQESIIESDDSDLQVISVKEKTIEILSSDEENSMPNSKQSINISTTKVVNRSTPKARALLQPKITQFNQPDVKYVSQDFYNKQLKVVSDLQQELIHAENLLTTLGKSLPDGGRQLSVRTERLRKDVEAKAALLRTYVIEEAVAAKPVFKSPPAPIPLKPQDQKKPFFNSEAPSWDDLSAAVNQIQPKYTGKQGLATFNNQKEMTVERLKDIHSSLKTCPTEDVLAEDPKGLRVNLMNHQRHALAWMAWRETQKPRGGILADDMGLGKTLTMIALVLEGKNCRDNGQAEGKSESESEDEETKQNHGWSSKGRKDFYSGGTLVICPASLVRQWEYEVENKVKRHTLTVCVHHGNNRDTKPKHLRTYDIVVTTYNIVARELKSQGALFGIKWKRAILDEAHVIRNHKSQSSMAVSSLRSKFRWALTGTPIQNKEMDVYALMKFLRCSPFDELPHWKKWIDNKSAGGQQRLNTLMKSLMLRRTKVQLQERGELKSLPKKRTELISVDLSKEEMNVYQKIMVYSRTLFAQFLYQRAERDTDLMYREEASRPTFMQSKDPNGAYDKVHQKFLRLHRGGKDIKSHEILVLLLRLRQICCHPGLIDAMLEDEDTQNVASGTDSDEEKIDLLEQLNKLAITDNSTNSSHSMEGDDMLKPEDEAIAKASARVLQRGNPVFDLQKPSTKMLKVLETLKHCVLTGGDKAIVVSQWTSVLNILKTHLHNEGISTLSLNGSIPVKDRQAIVNDFNDANSRKKVLLLSLTAGGVGLNLVGANHLLLIDLHWNPQLEAQAQDRIYRVGQQKDVIIYKFMCKGTVEEYIKKLQDKKMALADGVLTGAKTGEGSKLTIDDLKGLFGMA